MIRTLHVIKSARGLLVLSPFGYASWTWELGEASKLPRAMAHGFADQHGGEVIPLTASPPVASPLDLSPVARRPVEVVRVPERERPRPEQ